MISRACENPFSVNQVLIKAGKNTQKRLLQMFLKYVQLVRMAKLSGKVDFSNYSRCLFSGQRYKKCEISNWICFRFYHLYAKLCKHQILVWEWNTLSCTSLASFFFYMEYSLKVQTKIRHHTK